MERVGARDSAAFETLYDGYHRLVFGVALRVVGEAAIAEDVTQAVFLKVWSAPDAFRGGNLAAWLARVSRNAALDTLRARANRERDELPLDLPDDADLESTIAASVDAERVRAALARIPREQRELIELGFFGGVTHLQMAERTGIPLGTVKTRIRSGLRRMRDLLGETVSR